MGHHYVPRFLLREWIADVRNQGVLRGYYYDQFRAQLRVRLRGENFFCSVPNLFTVRGLPDGDHVIESIFFKNLDDAAALAHQLILSGSTLSPRQRVHFARLLLSLEARYPRMVRYVRERGRKNSLMMNSDPEIRELLDGWGEVRPANEVWDELVGFSAEDQAMEIVQKLTANERIGRALVEAPWGVFRRPYGCDQFVLGDRPLIRIKGLLAQNNVWILPISPECAWFCAMSQKAFEGIGRIPPKRFVHWVNECSALQSDKYVFNHREPTSDWLAKRLRKRAADLQSSDKI